MVANSGAESNIALKHNIGQLRYEARDGDNLAGFAQYALAKGLIYFTHTEVTAAYEGKGIASKIAKFALDDVRDGDPSRKVVPQCWYIKGWIERHPEYADLVSSDVAH